MFVLVTWRMPSPLSGVIRLYEILKVRLYETQQDAKSAKEEFLISLNFASFAIFAVSPAQVPVQLENRSIESL
jgi:hypothetical protein